MRSFAKPTFLAFAKSSFMPFSTSIKMPKTHFLNHFAHLLTHLSIFHYKKFKACESFEACIKLLLISLSWLPCFTHETSTLIFPLLDFKRIANFGWNSKMYEFQCISKFCSKFFLSFLLCWPQLLNHYAPCFG